MTVFDVAVAWNWDHDAGFIGFFRQACAARSLSLLEITPQNLPAAAEALSAGQLTFRSFMNRAADTDVSFLSLVRWARENGAFRVNPHEQEFYSADKATMHLELISVGLHTPYTIILAPYSEQPQLPILDLSPLGDSFAIKPAMGGGGQGVVLEATNRDQVLQARQQFPDDKYLVQAHVEPKLLDGRPAWFRVIYCVGEVFVSWWPPETHVYHPVTKEDVVRYGLGALYDMAVRIGDVCQLHLFSTEIALTQDDQFLAVDYVNDQIDLRLQSQAVDGVPDAIVQEITGRLAGLVVDALESSAP